MWEAIRENRRRSMMLILLMGILLILFGFLLGAGFAGGSSRLLSPERIAGGMLGVGVASVLWMVMMLAAYYGGDSLLLSSAKARRIQKEDLPQLWNVVEEMTIASGLGQMPKVYIIDDPEPNAFAVGRSPETASIAVTMGLLRRLNRDELQGVVAHEIGHIRNLDVRFMTLASVTLGTIVLLSEVFLRSMWYGGGRGRRRSSSSGGGQAQAILLVAALLVAILAPIAAQLLYFACSRKREYLADASAARFTRYPLGLASALEKIASTVSTGSKKVSRALAPMYIVNPLQSRSAVGLFSTHPPTEDRIRILRSMAGGAGLAQYEEAYRKVHGEGRGLLASRTIRDDAGAAIRPPSADPDPVQSSVQRGREALDFLDRLSGLLLIPCACGMRIKLPEGYRKDSIQCPRCGIVHQLPRVVESGASGQEDAHPAGEPSESGVYRRRSNGWESFQCSCGKTLQLSPNFAGTHVRCKGCGRKIEVKARA